MPSFDMLNELIPVFVTLFVIIDPLGLVPVFIVLTQGTSAAHRRRMAIRACLTSFFILAAFALIGEGLLGIFGIHMPAFRIAGGTLLFLIALEMLFEKRSQKRNERTTTQTPKSPNPRNPRPKTRITPSPMTRQTTSRSFRCRSRSCPVRARLHRSCC